MAQLRVVRFKLTGSREAFELALCIPRSDGSTTLVIYGDREIMCDTCSLCKAYYVHVDSMLKKATVLGAVMRDGPGLRGKLPDYQDVFARLDEDLDKVHAVKASAQLATHRRPQPALRDDTAQTTLKAFRAHLSSSQETCARLKSISAAVQPFEHNSQSSMPTGWSKTRLSVAGMQPINLLEPKTMCKVSALCRTKKLKPPAGFVKSHSYHYGKYEKQKLTSVLSLSVMKLNNMPGSIAVSIDIAASTDKHHSMTYALDSIKKILRKRRNPCVLFAQVAQTDIARDFWAGKLTKTRRASVLTALISTFDERYKIYEDTDDMAIFYE